MNTFGGTGLWCPEDGFYYDQLQVGGRVIPLRVRSMVGLLPLMACTVLDEAVLERFPGFTKRMRWFLENRPDLARYVTLAEANRGHRLLAIPSRERLERALRYPKLRVRVTEAETQELLELLGHTRRQQLVADRATL